MNNQMELSFLAVAQNEAFARMVISAFLVQTNPTLSVVSEVRTAVSEAVTNAIVHAYTEKSGKVILRAWAKPLPRSAVAEFIIFRLYTPLTEALIPTGKCRVTICIAVLGATFPIMMPGIRTENRG